VQELEKIKNVKIDITKESLEDIYLKIDAAETEQISTINPDNNNGNSTIQASKSDQGSKLQDLI
jgi:hypothetical protein